MIVTDELLTLCIEHKNINLILYGVNNSYIANYIRLKDFKLISNHYTKYYLLNNIYYIDVYDCKKKIDLIDLLKELCISPNFYSSSNHKKVIILNNFDRLNNIYQSSIKTIIDKSYVCCMFIIYANSLNLINKNIHGRFILLSTPYVKRQDLTTDLTYNKIIKLLKKNIFNKQVIKDIREVSYYYYMDHKNSNELQKLFIKRIGSNYTLPNSIKYNLVEELTIINSLYQHSYRKPIFLEWIIVSLFKHLQHYTYNLK